MARNLPTQNNGLTNQLAYTTVRPGIHPASDAPAELLVNCEFAIETEVVDVPFIAIAPPEISAVFPKKLQVADFCQGAAHVSLTYSSSVR